MDGQITIIEWLEDKDLEEKYPIPRLSKRWLDEEGWTDDWHYADRETPPEDEYYYTVWLTQLRSDKETTYTYTYALYSEGNWYVFNSTTDKWQPPFHWYKALIGWVRMPNAYQKDEAFVRKIGKDIDKDKYKRWEVAI